uniref:Uncharacterized protein n=1 Tax=uncultured marine virus TaxID=186617 RepID=A0A0F7L713_9VIRU|nr:hypothetical protein [uncultured marine virus]
MVLKVNWLVFLFIQVGKLQLLQLLPRLEYSVMELCASVMLILLSGLSLREKGRKSELIMSSLLIWLLMFSRIPMGVKFGQLQVHRRL